MMELLPAYLRGGELVPVARLRTRREVMVAQGAEIVDDSVAVLEGQRVSRRFREVEVELLDGDEKTLRRLEKELRKAGARRQVRCSRSSIGRSTWPAAERGSVTKGTQPGRRSGSRSRPTIARCSPTTPARAAATIPRTCTSFASRSGGCGRISARRARSSTRNGPSRSARSSAGSAGISARHATSM